MRKFLLVAIATTMLAACGDGETYPLAAKDVRSKLLGIEPPNFVFGDGVGVDSMVSQIGQDQVRWTVRADGTSMVRLTATVTPEGDQSSHVALTVEPMDAKQAGQIRHNVATTGPALNLYKSAMEEQIAAKLENRSFDMAAIQGQLMASMGTTMKQVNASLDDAVKNFDAQDRARQEAKADAEFRRETSTSDEPPAEPAYE